MTKSGKAIRLTNKQKGYMQSSSAYSKRFMGSGRGLEPELKEYHSHMTKAETVNLTLAAGTNALMNGLTTNPQINNLAQGTALSQRIGSKFLIRSLLCKWKIFRIPQSTKDLSAGTNSYFLNPMSARLVVVLDTQANGQNPAWSDVFDTTDQGGGTQPAVEQFPLIANNRRFKILSDERVFMPGPDIAGATATAVINGQAYCKQYYKVWKEGLLIDCASSTANISEIRSNNLVAFVVFDENMSTFISGQWNVALDTRIRFSDS